MNTHSIYNRKAFGLDNRVWIVLLLTIILSLGLLSYSMMKKKECIPVDFMAKSLGKNNDSVFVVGESVSFISNFNSPDVKWEFGDNSPKLYGASVDHVFLTEGYFFVSAGLNRDCQKIKKVHIIKAIATEQTSAIPNGSEIEGPASTVAQRPETFTCLVTADYWEWSIANLPGVKTGQKVKLSFPAKGPYTVWVTLNHDRTKRYPKEIIVEDSIAPLIPKPEDLGPLVPETLKNNIPISEEMFKTYMQKVVAGEYNVHDFDNFLFFGGSTMVVLNGHEKKPEHFDVVCGELKHKKRPQRVLWKKTIEITKVVFHKDANNCIASIDIDYE